MPLQRRGLAIHNRWCTHSKNELLIGSGGVVYKLNGKALEPVITGKQIGEALGENIEYSGDTSDLVGVLDVTSWLATCGGVVA